MDLTLKWWNSKIYKNQSSVLYFQYQVTFQCQKRLSGTYKGEPRTGPPCCALPGQQTTCNLIQISCFFTKNDDDTTGNYLKRTNKKQSYMYISTHMGVNSSLGKSYTSSTIIYLVIKSFTKVYTPCLFKTLSAL